jgi:hypothetical protein
MSVFIYIFIHIYIFMYISIYIQGGLLVASSTVETAGGHNVFASNMTASRGGGISGSAGKGYLAVIMSCGSRYMFTCMYFTCINM